MPIESCNWTPSDATFNIVQVAYNDCIEKTRSEGNCRLTGEIKTFHTSSITLCSFGKNKLVMCGDVPFCLTVVRSSQL
ncbi:hypothetical protein OUZ56_021134 [Daphnia magna]|uniref:Uncharacterized protein n=1 Tax=Daphnia magna TaxID=35525 RepID=A0ABQ9ZGI0_9CRUS|nr:hypothetical protein OUZ56_021134 [Daphnia magna]